ncbi:aldo/keto reductase [Inquilinus limosus]|uniref:aldo/keto reductase n=1 Tax=Inquilinus limosus TaxID=171674 RepID=UPI000411638E|nr:aldo/keto reductase [Inquilinus limosus]
MATIPTKRLGSSGLVVSRLALGTMTFGATTDEAEAKRIVASALDRGVNHIDTADTYAGGRSEEIVGRAIAADRHHWVLATKLANPSGPGPNQRGLSRKWIIEEVQRSLKRLGTDFIDILYLHKEDHGTPLEETVRAVADLQRSGAIRYLGLSNFKAWRIARIAAICDQAGIDRPVVDQPLYHALNRTVEVEVLPACRALGIGVFCYSPTARGMLTGKYAVGEPPPPDSRAALQNRRMMETEYVPAALAAAAEIGGHARRRGCDPAAFAVAWVLANEAVTGAIAGPRTMAQWDGYLAAFDVDWTAEDEAAVDRLVPPGTTAIPNFIDPIYPVEGRFASHHDGSGGAHGRDV